MKATGNSAVKIRWLCCLASVWCLLWLAPLAWAQDKTRLEEAAQLSAASFRLLLANKYTEAIEPGESALAIYEKELGPEAQEIGFVVINLADAYKGLKDWARAMPLYQRAVTVYEKSQAPVASLQLAVNKLAAAYQAQGDDEQALPLFERSLALKAQSKGPDDFYVGIESYQLAQIYNKRGYYRKALPLLQRTLEIFEKAKTDEIVILGVLKDLAETHQTQGNYLEAAALHQRALTLGEKILGADQPALAPIINNLALLYQDQGDYGRALPLFQRALALMEKGYGPESPQVATMLNNLGVIYQAQGDYERALPLFQRALAIDEKVFGPEHTQVATVTNNLGFIYQERADYERAAAYFQRSLAIREKFDGPEHPRVALALSNLATLYKDWGQDAEAVTLNQRALTIREKTLGPEHPDVAISLSNLATLRRDQGDYAAAAQMLLKALAISEKTLGPQHPFTTVMLQDLARLYYTQGDTAQTLRYLQREAEVSEGNIATLLATGSEKQKQLYLNSFARNTNFTLAVHLQGAPHNRAALELAFTTILRRKGRALDVFTDQLAALRQRAVPADQALLDQLTAARARAAALILRGQGNTAEAKEAETESERLEDAISRRSAEFRATAQPVTLERVRAALPRNSALVEFAVYQPYNAQAKTFNARFGAPRYVAYVLGSGAAGPQFVDLGDAAPLEAAAQRLHAALLTPKTPLAEVKQAGRDADERIMQPVRRLLGPAQRLFLSPDGALNLIPFAALVDEKGRYLLEHYSLSYLTSGRDLLRLPAQGATLNAPAVVANPLFDGGNGMVAGTNGRRDIGLIGANQTAKVNSATLDFTSFYYAPLSGTATEATAVSALLPQALTLTQGAATEAALKRIVRPRLLHIATHGFFRPDAPRAAAASEARALGLTAGDAPPPPQENPMLRSGLILAGVNQGQSGPENDGVLTALEVAGLDLYGTQLVVLSACETGLGDVRNGAGVYGLRRALFLAGSETQIMSLWQVSDNATRDLMIAYYQRLQAGEGRTEALRQVQLAMLRGAKTAWWHPYYWAAFIPSGAWTPLAVIK